MRAEPLEIGIDPFIQFLGVDPALVSTKMDAEETGDHRRTVRTEKLPRSIAFNKLGELEDAGDGGHGSILKDGT
ncbi:hypothetical protein, partial [Microbacterium sp.]|uniref:hypothetical protein n=1 Tax=Microbacterium sp. TaxID=51671 RepID=UPI0025F55862